MATLVRPRRGFGLQGAPIWSAGAETVLSAPVMTARTPKVRPGPGLGWTEGCRVPGNAGKYTERRWTRVCASWHTPSPTPAPPTHARPTLSSSHLSRVWEGVSQVSPPFPGPRPLPPPRSRATVGRSQSAAAQSRPLAARRIAAPPRPIQRVGDARFPPAQSTPGPAPRARGPQPTPAMYPQVFHGSPPPLHAARPPCGSSLQHPRLQEVPPGAALCPAAYFELWPHPESCSAHPTPGPAGLLRRLYALSRQLEGYWSEPSSFRGRVHPFPLRKDAGHAEPPPPDL